MWNRGPLGGLPDSTVRVYPPAPPSSECIPPPGPLFQVTWFPFAKCLLCAGCGRRAKGGTEGTVVLCLQGAEGCLQAHLMETSGRALSLESDKAGEA